VALNAIASMNAVTKSLRSWATVCWAVRSGFPTATSEKQSCQNFLVKGSSPQSLEGPGPLRITAADRARPSSAAIASRRDRRAGGASFAIARRSGSDARLRTGPLRPS
jgi:hypothetical protein